MALGQYRNPEAPAFPALETAVCELGPHEHLCLIYETLEQQFAAVVPFLRAGIDRGEKCLYITDENTAAAVLDALRDGGVDTDAALARGALVLATGQDSYLRTGRFDPEAMIDLLRELHAESKAAGFSALRVTGEMTWALAGAPGSDRLTDYECMLAPLFDQLEIVAICQYNRARFSAGIIREVIRTHPTVIYGERVCRNFYYVPPAELNGDNRDELEVERLLRNVVAREQAEEEIRRLNEQLTQRLEEFETLLNASPLSIAVAHDPLANDITVNPAAARLLGIPGDVNASKTGEASSDLSFTVLQDGREVPPDDLPMQRAAREDIDISDMEYELVRSDGSVINLLEYASPLHNRDGSVRGSIGIFVDITERTRAEDELRQQRENLHAFLMQAPVPICVISGPDLVFELANPLYVQVTGGRQLTGLPLLQAMPEIEGQGFDSMLRAVMETGEPQIGREALVLLDRSGTGVPEETYWTFIYAPIRETDNSVQRVMCLCQEVTDQVKSRREVEAVARELAERNSLIEAIASNMSVGLLMMDADGRIEFMNPAAETITGYKFEQVQGRIAHAMVHFLRPDGSPYPVSDCPIDQANVATTPVAGHEDLFVRPDGSFYNVLCNLAPVVRDGRREGMLLDLQDVTEQVRARERMRDVTARLALQYDIARVLADARSLPQAAGGLLSTISRHLGWWCGALWTLDRDGTSLRSVEFWQRPGIDVSAFAEATRGRTFPAGSGLPGRTWHDGRPVWMPDVVHDPVFLRAAEAEASGLHAAFAVPVQSGSEIVGVMEFFSPEIQQPDQALLDLMTAVSAQIGQSIERWRAEDSLRQQTREADAARQRYLDLVQGLDAIVWEADAQTFQFTFVSKRAESLLGYPVEQWLAEPRFWADHIHQDDRDQSVQFCLTCTQEGQDHEFEYRMLAADGSVLWMRDIVHVVTEQSGAPTLLRGIMVDITQRKQAEEQMAAAAALKDQFLGLVSHELRTPISTVVANALILLRRGDIIAPEDRLQALRDIASEGEKLQRVIENLLLLTRIEASESPEFELVSLRRLVDDQLEAFARRSPARSIRVVEEDAVGLVNGQPALLAMVINNLLGNADKYSPPEKPIELRLRSGDDSNVELLVRDHGIGIGDADESALFTPFFRTSEAKGYATGMGLGLAVCKRIVEAHGGRIWVRGRPEGGSDFAFSLPLPQVPSPPED